jgi:hypothetical protein
VKHEELAIAGVSELIDTIRSHVGPTTRIKLL